MSRRRGGAGQLPLFAPPPPSEVAEGRSRSSGWVGAAADATGGGGAWEEIRELARRLPRHLRLGGSTWSFPGWQGLVYDGVYTPARLARHGLAAYARHPLLRAVGIDRTHYRPLPAADFARYAAAVPDDFRFLVKAHDACTLARFPDRPRYGTARGLVNPRFLDAAYAAAEVVAPYVEGLGGKGGALLFEFAPQDLGAPGHFAAALHAFLDALPRGPLYAVELRNRELLGGDYASALAATGACHCFNVHPRMPDLDFQAQALGVPVGGATAAASSLAPLLVVRWLLARDARYEEASRRYAPFNRLAAPDPDARRAVAALVRAALAAGQPALVTVNNNAEGCAPLSILELARDISSPGPAAC